jgi:hypothetical protein
MLQILLLLFLVSIGFYVPGSTSGRILFSNDFEACTTGPSGGAYGSIAISDKRAGGYAHGGNCSIKNQGGNLGGTTGYWPCNKGACFGATTGFLPQQEIWIRDWIMFSPNWIIGPNPGYTGIQGPHMQRLYTGSANTSQSGNPEMDFDLFVNKKGEGTPQINFWGGSTSVGGTGTYTVFGGNGGTANTSVVAGTLGTWHCFEIHVKMNSGPHTTDGLTEIYRDGVRIQHFTGNLEGNLTYGFNSVNLMSNIGGNGGAPPPPPWPSQSAWYLDDVAISTLRVGCR